MHHVSHTQLNSIPTVDHPKLATLARCASFGDMCERTGLPRDHPSILQIELTKKWADAEGLIFEAGTLGLQHVNSSGTHVVFEGDFPLQEELKAADDAAPTAPPPPRPPRAPRAPKAPKAPKAPRKR